MTSLSLHAYNYLFALPKSVKALALVECHKVDELSTCNTFKDNGFTASYNIPEKASVLTHGGECLAIRSHIHSTPVPIHVLEMIQEFFNAQLRFAARILHIRKSQIIIITVYLWASEKFSERNIVILRSILMLIKYLGIPWILLGDFNIKFEEFCESDWPTLFKGDMLHPNMKSSTSMSLDRVIDYGMHCKRIKAQHGSL